MKSVLVGNQRVVLGDCIEGMKRMRARSVDVVVTSPPYNIGMAYGQHNDRMAEDNYHDWMDRVANEIARVLKLDGSVFLNVGSNGAHPWRAIDVALMFRRSFMLQNSIAWVKSVAIGERTYGHFRPITSPRFLNPCYEMIYHFTLNSDVELDRLAIGVPYTAKQNVERFNHASDVRCRGNAWHMVYQTVQSAAGKFHHPAAFPVELPLMCIKLHGGKGLRVLDPFLGTGTTLIASALLGHQGVGFDVDPAYARTALRRLRSL